MQTEYNVATIRGTIDLRETTETKANIERISFLQVMYHHLSGRNRHFDNKFRLLVVSSWTVIQLFKIIHNVRDGNYLKFRLPGSR